MDSPLGSLWQVSLACRDLSQCIGFYRDTLGLELIAELPRRGWPSFASVLRA